MAAATSLMVLAATTCSQITTAYIPVSQLSVTNLRHRNFRLSSSSPKPITLLPHPISALLDLRNQVEITAILDSVRRLSPAWYFAYLNAAAVGVPVSEDILTIFSGTYLFAPGLPNTRRITTLVALYAGVVASDALSFSIAARFRSRAGVPGLESAGRKGPVRQRLMGMVKRSGRYIGFVQRFCVGLRGPISALAGLSGVKLGEFVIGSALGALVTLSAQLWIGYRLRHATIPIIASTVTAHLSTISGAVGLIMVGGLLYLWLGKVRA